MDIINLIVFLAVGALVGWLAGVLIRGSGFGVVGNMVVGIVGAIFGGFVFGLVGITSGGWLGAILMAVIGAVILLYLIRIVKRV